MGWLISYDKTKQEQIDDLLRPTETYRPLKHSVVGNHLWAVFELTDKGKERHPEQERFIALFLLRKDRGMGWGYKDIYEPVETRPGADEIHALVGGKFLIREGESLAFDLRQHEAGEVLLHPGPREPELPLDCLVPIEPEKRTRITNYRKGL